MASYSYNYEHNGIEIDFEGVVPDEDVRDEMKSLGFRWNRNGKYWYAKQNKKTIEFAKNICDAFDTEEDEYNEYAEDDDIPYYIDCLQCGKEYDSLTWATCPNCGMDTMTNEEYENNPKEYYRKTRISYRDSLGSVTAQLIREGKYNPHGFGLRGGAPK